MKCTDKERETCNVEKMGCEGCYYNEDNDRDINNLIEELTNVRPNELSTEGLKLFNKINEIIDKNKKKSIEIICYQEELENSIPVSLVEETINDFRDKTVWGYNDWKYDENVYKAELNIIDKLEEKLLEKRK